MKPLATTPSWRLLTGAAFLSLLIALLASMFGTLSIDLIQGWKEWFTQPATQWSRNGNAMNLRLARIAIAWLAGGALATAGAVIQTVLANGLATPYTLGVAAAGSFGAVLVLAFPALAIFGAPSAAIFSLTAALAGLALVLRIARHSQRADGLLLAGITLNFLFGAGVILVRFLADPLRLPVLERWMLGSLDAVRIASALAPAPWIAVGLLLCMRQSQALDQLAFDAELAAARGVRVQNCRRWSLLGAGFLTAGVVAYTGPIGFIGLLVPHAVRPFTGLRHGLLLPISFFAGGGLLVAADLLARSVQIGGRHSEMPVGIVTALVGGPVFLALLLRRQS